MKTFIKRLRDFPFPKLALTLAFYAINATAQAVSPQDSPATSQQTPASASSQKFVVVILGDSITEGYGLTKEQAYPALVETQLKGEGYVVQIINGGISGSTSASGPSRMNWYLKSKPDLVIVALGANDGLRGGAASSLKENLKETITAAKAKNIAVGLAGMRMPPNYGLKYTKEFAEVYPALAKEENIAFYPFLLEGVAGVTGLNQPDGIHPNEKGQQIIANKFAKFLKKNWLQKLANKKSNP